MSPASSITGEQSVKMSIETTVSASKFTVPKLAPDGSNWVTYRARFEAVAAAKGLKPYLMGQVRRPQLPPPIVRAHPYVSVFEREVPEDTPSPPPVEESPEEEEEVEI